MASIYHIPAWWPSGEMEQNGIYIYELLRNIAESDQNHVHTVVVFNTSVKWISARHFFRDIVNLSGKDKPRTFESVDNIKLVEVPRVIGINPKTGINFISSLIKRNIRIIQSLPRIPDLIHVHVSYPSVVIGYELSMKFNIPFMVSEHSSKFPDPRFKLFGYDQSYLTKVFHHSKKNIAVSNFLANKFRPFKVSPEIIHNFVSWDRPIVPRKEEKTGFALIWIGRMNDKIKRPDILLNALKLLILKGKPCTCTIIGDGEYLHEYKELAIQLGIDASIVWVGYAKDKEIQSYLRVAHCLVISSESESFGIAAIEALSYGLPVLSTACGGVEEIINKTCGLIVEKNNPEALAGGLAWMMDHIETFDRRSIQDYCYQNYDRYFIASTYLDIYKSVLPT